MARSQSIAAVSTTAKPLVLLILLSILCSPVPAAVPLPKLAIPNGFGVNIHFRGQPADLDLIRDGGFKFIRMDLSWSGVERSKGAYDFDRIGYDALTEGCTKRNIRILYILDYSNKLYEAERSVRTEAGRRAFAAFAEAVPVKTELTCPIQTAPLVLPDLKNVTSSCSYQMIDALAAKSQDGNLLISLVHRGTSNPIDLEITLKDFTPTGRAEIQTLSADVPWAENTLEKPEAIIPATTTGKIQNGKIQVTIKPYSVLKITTAKFL